MDGGGKRARKHDEGMDDVFGDKDAMIALSRVAQKLATGILEATGVLIGCDNEDEQLKPLSKKAKEIDLDTLIAYAHKVSYSTGGPLLAPQGLFSSFTPHYSTWRNSRLYQGVPGLSVQKEEEPKEELVPPVQQPPAMKPVPSGSSGLNLLIDDEDEESSSDSSDDSSSSSSSSSSGSSSG